MNQVLQVMVRAREMVADRWIQGNAHDGNGGRCAGQAITDAYIEVLGRQPNAPWCLCCAHQDNDFYKMIRAFTTTIGETNIPAWNDSSLRTKAEVVRAFDLTIERLQMREAESVKVLTTPQPVAAPKYQINVSDMGDVWTMPATVKPISASLFQKVKDLVSV